jgi:hypothetical protein
MFHRPSLLPFVMTQRAAICSAVRAAKTSNSNSDSIGYLVGWPTDYTKRFIADLLKSHRLRIQPSLYRQDAPVIEFYLDGLSEAMTTGTAAGTQRPVTPK